MKTTLKLCLMLLTLHTAVNLGHAQGTAFTYNGRLNDNGAPANGNYDLRFTLYDAEVGVNGVAGPLLVTPVAVANGLFSVRVDFGAGVFTGPARWLEISVRPVGVGDFTTLAPRQEVTSSPYAIHAASAGTAADVSAGSVVKSLNTLKDDVTLAAGANVTITPNGNTLTLAAAGAGGSGIWSVLNNNAYYNAGNVGIGTTAPTSKLDIVGDETLRGNLVFSSSTRQMITLWDNGVDPTFGIGVQSAAFYQRCGTGSGFAWFYGGVHNNGQYNPGTGGTTLMILDGTGRLGIGTTTPQAKLDVNGNSNIRGTESFGASTRQMITLYDSGVNSTFGIGVQDGAFYQRCGTGSGFAWFYGGEHNNGQYNPGTGGTTLMTLTGTGRLGIGSTTPQAQLEVVGQDAIRLVGGQPFLTFLDDTAGYAKSRIQGAGGDLSLETHDYTISGNPLNGLIVLKNGTSYVGIGNNNPQAMLDVAGTARVKVLTITGGADVAEPFQMSTEEISKGSVVVIDKEHPGRLKRSVQAYDKRVAGIISGANGVNPGISLHQEGTLDGGQNVALSGRVYVLADTASGEIEPGDLLTTSDTPGHAMKVRDHARAQGAILGKAMSSLKEGQGMVLVLVTLQ